MHKVLVNGLFKFAQEKVVRWTDRPYMAIAVNWDIKQQTKPKKMKYFFNIAYGGIHWGWTSSYYYIQDLGCLSFHLSIHSSSFYFLSITWEQMDGTLPNFWICIHIDKIFIGIVTCHCLLFVIELWPLIDVRISFPLNIFRANRKKWTKFSICIDIDKV